MVSAAIILDTVSYQLYSAGGNASKDGVQAMLRATMPGARVLVGAVQLVTTGELFLPDTIADSLISKR